MSQPTKEQRADKVPANCFDCPEFRPTKRDCKVLIALQHEAVGRRQAEIVTARAIEAARKVGAIK